MLHKLPLVLGKVCGSPKILEKGLGKVWLESQVKWGCVCGGGDEERAPSSPLKLEEELSKKVTVNLHFYTKRPLFILRGSNFGP